MACQLHPLTAIENISSIKDFLFPREKSSEKDYNEQGEWEGDWDWQQEQTEENDGDNEGDNSWLQSCCISISPTLDIMAIAYEQNMVLLGQKWDDTLEGTDSKFSVAWKGSLRQEERETITDVTCLPLASQKRSSQGGPDWVCVIVGFSSGYVRMYTETGTLLLSQILHEESVLKLKCRTYEAPRHTGIAEQHEELTILYPKAIVTVDGFSLFQSLRACRNQVARAAASGSDAMQPPPLAYKKWGLQGQQQIVDQASCGVWTPNAFDQLQTASMLDGCNATMKSSPPALSIYATVGTEPYVAYYHAIEGSGQPLLTDMAYAVASKLKSALFDKVSAAGGWFGFGSKQHEEIKEKTKPKIEPATPLRFRYGLPDLRRSGETILLSPHNNLAATTDSFGRIILIDILKGIALRMWKGYRDAQLGWIQVRDEQERRSNHAQALFLIIYAPRRGLLEVWCAEQGSRVAAFNISKWCRLIYADHGIMGLNNVTCHSVKSKHFQCCLMDTEGTIRTIEIPFHLALSDKNNKRARDVHLLKKLKTILKDNAEEDAVITSILLEMKITNIIKQGLDKVLSCRTLTVSCMLKMTTAVLDHLTQEGSSSMDTEKKMFLQYCKLQLQLINTFIKTSQLNSSCMETQTSQDLAGVLSLTEPEIEDIDKLLSKYNRISSTASQKRVHFDVDSGFDVASFLSCFHCQTIRSDQTDVKYGSGINMFPDLTSDKVQKLGRFLFNSCLQNGNLNENFSMILQEISVPANQIMKLLIDYWLSQDCHTMKDCGGLFDLVRLITTLTDVAEVAVDPSSTSEWWQTIKTACSSTDSLSAAITMSVVCRSVAIETMTKYNNSKEENSTSEMSEWESVSLDVEQWNVLVKQLEDLVALSCVIKSHQQPLTGVTVDTVLDGGKGIVSELIAKWNAGCELEPGIICKHSQVTSEDSELQENLEELRERFPRSFTHDAVMVNCSWECAVLWNRDMEVVSHLQRSMSFLKLVQNALLQHGVCCMLWQMFIVKRISAAVTLMEKVGKTPKDRLCRKEVGMSDTCLEKFLGIVCELLDITMQANCDASDVPVFTIEDLWQNIQGPTALVELAIDQRSTNYGLIRHHYHVCIIMHAIMAFGMKSVKPLSLFDVKGQKAFLMDFCSHPYFSQQTDAAILMHRRQFLCRVITSAIQLLPIDGDKPDASIVRYWSNVLMQIAKDLEVDVECLKRTEIKELYSAGYDKMAEEVLLTVNDHEVMGSQLLLLAGQRLAHFVMRCDPPGSTETLSKLSPTVNTWIKSMDPNELRHPNVPLSDTATLVGHSVNHLAEGHSEYNMAIALVELIQQLM